MKRIGMDAGGSLIKLSFEESGRLHVKTYPYKEKDKLLKWLNMLAPEAIVYGTGGKWQDLEKQMKQRTSSVDEFASLVRGANHLLATEYHRKKEYILVSIGTGTSIFHVTGDSFERVLGSGIGGGTWMGLGHVITGVKSFSELVEQSASGNRENSDLLVKDIYGDSDSPLLGDLTAANFGKSHLHGASSADHLRALTQMIAEVVISLTGTVVASSGIKDVVFVGSTLSGNRPLQDALKSFENILSYEPIFLEKGAYAGAVGAMLE